MPKNSPEYDRQYRLKNSEKLRAYERERYKRRSGKSNLEELEDQILGVDPAFKDSDHSTVHIQTVRRCMASFCKEVGLPQVVDGCTVYLCPNHIKYNSK